MEIPQAVLAAVNEWRKGPYEEYRQTYGLVEECPGEVVCSNVSELHPDPNNIIILMGINPGKNHDYTIEQNVRELNDVLPENRRWHGWGNHPIPMQIPHILWSIYPDRFVNDNETIHGSVLYTNLSYFRAPHQDGVTQEHLDVSWPLVHNVINLVETPIFAFGEKSYKNVAQMLQMEVVVTTLVGWGNWRLFLYRNNSTNRKMVGMPHLSYPWATRPEVPDNLWDIIRNFLEHDVVPQPEHPNDDEPDDEHPDIVEVRRERVDSLPIDGEWQNVPPVQIAVGGGERVLPEPNTAVNLITALRGEIESLRTEVEIIKGMVINLKNEFQGSKYTGSGISKNEEESQDSINTDNAEEHGLEAITIGDVRYFMNPGNGSVYSRDGTLVGTIEEVESEQRSNIK